MKKISLKVKQSVLKDLLSKKIWYSVKNKHNLTENEMISICDYARLYLGEDKIKTHLKASINRMSKNFNELSNEMKELETINEFLVKKLQRKT